MLPRLLMIQAVSVLTLHPVPQSIIVPGGREEVRVTGVPPLRPAVVHVPSMPDPFQVQFSPPVLLMIVNEPPADTVPDMLVWTV